MMILPTGKSQNGFTLMEVILSVMILSIGLIAINQTLLRSLSLLHYSETRFEANRFAENKIWEIQDAAFHQGKAPQRKEEGVLLGSHKTFSYHLQAVTVRGSEFLYEIRMAIHWLEAGKENGLSRSFYARLPTLTQS